MDITEVEALQPWDETAMIADLLEMLVRLPRVRHDLVRAPSSPGCYAMFLGSDRREVVDAVGPIVASGRCPGYVGLAQVSLKERLGRYRQSFAGTAIKEREVWVSTIPCTSAASAAFVEAALLMALAPVPLNGLGGFGQKRPGSTRRQRISPADALWPGKRWAPASSAKDQAMARLRVLSDLTRLDPGGLRWPPLTSSSA